MDSPAAMANVYHTVAGSVMGMMIVVMVKMRKAAHVMDLLVMMGNVCRTATGSVMATGTVMAVKMNKIAQVYVANV